MKRRLSLFLLIVLALSACSETPVDGAAPIDASQPDKPASDTANPRPDKPVQAAKGAWSNPDTWGGTVPQDGDYVKIEEGVTVTLDTATASLSGLYIKGELIAADTDVTLTADHIAVQGLLQIGSEATPFTKKAALILTGNDPEQVTPFSAGIGNKALGVLKGGRLELHGSSREKVSWTQLGAHAELGATRLTLKEDVNWEPGDRIVLAPSGFDPFEAEELTLTSVAGRTVEFTPALKYEHFGELQGYEGKTLDQRAEVGLLSRNIVIQSDPESVDGRVERSNQDPEVSKARFGGHVIVLEGGQSRIEGTAFKDLGQETFLGRYAFHWHLAGDVTGQYVRNSSVENSFTRGIVVHSSQNAVIENNVVYKTHSHAYVFAEAGDEHSNVFNHNLGLLVIRLPEERRFFQDDMDDPKSRDARIQDEHRPSVFWGRNPFQTLVGNTAAGVFQGNGFFIKGGYGIVESYAQYGMVFKNNKAHTNYARTHGNDRYPPLTKGYGVFVNDFDYKMQVEDFEAYKSSLSGIWLESKLSNLKTAKNVKLADNGTGVILFKGALENALLVGESANTRVGESGKITDSRWPFTGLPTIGAYAVGGGIHTVKAHGGPKFMQLKDVTFVNFSDPAIAALDPGMFVDSSVEGLEFVNTPDTLKMWKYKGQEFSGGFLDKDGSISGTNGSRLILGAREVQLSEACESLEGVESVYHVCPDTLALVNLEYKDQTSKDNLIRDDGATSAARIKLDGAYTPPNYMVAKRSYTLADTVIKTSAPLFLEGEAGAWVKLTIPLAAQPYAYFVSDKDDSNYPLLQAADKSAVDGAGGDRYYYDDVKKELYIKLVSGLDKVKLCVNESCS